MARLAAATLGVIPGGSISAESMPESPVSCGVRRKLYAFRPKEPYAPRLPRSGGAMVRRMVSTVVSTVVLQGFRAV
jgi:hypothetical protein